MNKGILYQKRIIIVMVAALVLLWIGDSVFDILRVRDELSADRLAVVTSPHEFFFRLMSLAIIIFFAATLTRNITKKQQAQRDLDKYIAALESSMDGIAIFDRDGKCLLANNAIATMNGFGAPQDLIGKPLDSFYDERSVSLFEQIISPTIEKSGRWRGEMIAKRKNGSTYFQEVSVARLDDEGSVTIVRDITWRKRSEERLRKSERFLNMIFNSIRDPFCIVDSDFQIIRINDAYAQLKGKSAQELIGRKCYEALIGRRGVCEGCVVDRTFHSTDPCAKEKRITFTDGNEGWVEIYTYPIMDDDGRATHVIEYTRDITDRKRAEDDRRRLIERLDHQSRTDELTGLLNRRALTESLQYEIERAGRYAAELSLLLCDLDEFKKINDSYGHDAGDRVLQVISAVLKTIFRKTDIVGRYGGDEFMLILPETSPAGAESLAGKLRDAIESADLRLPGGVSGRMGMSMSIGIAGLTDPQESMDSFIKRADDDMYARKHEARGKTSGGGR